ncbi:hypothetical protein ACFP2T_25665 [Plantactinospora solaniradicis]|uniref:Uncharacterized protein n=1 Tax=Plantactinospora solaniradicis TaxID=1723736 RepID=A0ABW1KF81_9ACTN
MQSGRHQYRLAVGFQRGIELGFMVVYLTGAVAAIVAVCSGYALGKFLVQVVADGVDPLNWGPFSLPSVMTVILVVPLWFWMLVVIRSIYPGAWLMGTRLTVQDGLRRVIDLADARSMSLHSTTERLAVPASVSGVGSPPMVPLLLVCSDSREVRLRLASRERVLLPPAQLVLLANALSAARCPGAAETVAWLRATAASTQAYRWSPYPPGRR